MVLLSGCEPDPVQAQERGYDPTQEEAYVNVVLTEAAGESYAGKVAVAEVLRNRDWQLEGFVGLRRSDRSRFTNDPKTVAEAVRALRTAKDGSRTVGLATHFESTDFPTPWWVKKKRKGKPVTVFVKQIGKHRFYREVMA